MTLSRKEQTALAEAIAISQEPESRVAELGERARRHLAHCRAEQAAWERGKAQREGRDRKAAERRELAETHRHKRRWVLCGFFVEDQTAERYTLSELERWAEWAAYFRFREPTVVFRCFADDGSEIVSLNRSANFRDVCGNRVPVGENIAEMARDLEEYVGRMRRGASC